MQEYVKLYMYQHEGDKTFVEGFKAEKFEDFLIIQVKNDITEEEFGQLEQAFGDLKTQIIVAPEVWDLEFYGVKITENEGLHESEG